jgi:hypothetical protein
MPTGWVKTDVEKFLHAFDSYWPGRLKFNDPTNELLKTWVSVCQLFNPQVAVVALRECFETQEKNQYPPTIVGFKAQALEIQRHVDEKLRLAKIERKTGERYITGREAAMDDSLWEELLDKAAAENRPKRHDWLLQCRQRMLQGGPVLPTTSNEETTWEEI